MQHGALDYSAALPMMRASVTSIGASVPWLDPAIIMKALDAGALNIICPMIHTADEAARFVSYMRYPPLGQRSFVPTRAGYRWYLSAAPELMGFRPHARGLSEHRPIIQLGAGVSSPRARVIVLSSVPESASACFVPTRAGYRFGAVLDTRRPAVSSPRARVIGSRGTSSSCHRRFVPTRAGYRAQIQRIPIRETFRPHARGLSIFACM